MTSETKTMFINTTLAMRDSGDCVIYVCNGILKMLNVCHRIVWLIRKNILESKPFTLLLFKLGM